MRKDYEQSIPDLYTQRGSFGNNTTIPERERHFIANSDPEPWLEEGRMKFRSEQALHLFYQEWGLAPKGTWMDFEGATFDPLPDFTQTSFSRQLKVLGRISKSQRNREIFLKKHSSTT
jgi:hypothetical protein